MLLLSSLEDGERGAIVNTPSLATKALNPLSCLLYLEKFAISQPNFPVIGIREFALKHRRCSVSTRTIGVSELRNLDNSLKNSLFAGNLAADGCDQHCAASQHLSC